ncbi:MAG TPA: metal-dependent hydrolase [Polyangiaceae bacterium]|nr:metal-dependent hydrolase [Polyangiaceae bacterium]
MDPITQGLFGAAVALAVLGERGKLAPGWIACIGAAGGMAADLDVLIRSASDPLLAVEYRRHFTHALTFAPLGGALAALPWFSFERCRRHARSVLGASMLGFASHGPLAAFGSQGTLLFWPWSTMRVALGFVSSVDIVFTIPLLLAVVVAARRGARTVARWGLLYCAVYLGLGAVQKGRALDVQVRLADRRGQHIDRGEVFPSPFNLVAWRSVYESDGRYYVDQVRVPFIGKNCMTSGVALPNSPNPHARGPVAGRAHRVVRWLANGWVARDPGDPSVLGDLRNSFLPFGATPLFGARIDEEADTVEWIDNRARRSLGAADLRLMIFEDPPGSTCE